MREYWCRQISTPEHSWELQPNAPHTPTSGLTREDDDWLGKLHSKISEESSNGSHAHKKLAGRQTDRRYPGTKSLRNMPGGTGSPLQGMGDLGQAGL
eukprot:6346-Hanusia_phi.AAC.2